MKIPATVSVSLRRLDRLLERVEQLVLSTGIMALAAVTISNVIARNLFGTSLSFAEEVSGLLVVLITFLGIGYGARHARHIRMSAIYDQFTGRWRKGLMVLSCLGTALLLAILAFYAVRYVGKVHAAGSLTPALRLPLYWVYLWVPVGLAIGALQYLLAAWRNLTTEGVHLSFQQPEAFEPPGGEG